MRPNRYMHPTATDGQHQRKRIASLSEPFDAENAEGVKPLSTINSGATPPALSYSLTHARHAKPVAGRCSDPITPQCQNSAPPMGVSTRVPPENRSTQTEPIQMDFCVPTIDRVGRRRRLRSRGIAHQAHGGEGRAQSITTSAGYTGGIACAPAAIAQGVRIVQNAGICHWWSTR